MLYEYHCPKCDIKFEVAKHHTLYRQKESCRECGTTANKLISLSNLSKVEKAEYNHGLGCYVKGRTHRKEIMKQRNLVEVGNESAKLIHKEAKSTLDKRLSWEGVE